MPETVLSVGADAGRFRDAGFEVTEAAAGTDLLELAAEKRPSLVVLAMDGLSECRRLKADPRTASIPVLHIAGAGEPYADYPQSLESGADAYLQEPVDLRALAAVAAALIRAAKPPAAVAFSNERLAALIDSIPYEVWFADAQGRFTLANPIALREFKIDVSGPVNVEEMARSLEVYRPDGSPRPVEESPALRALRGETVRDQDEIVRTPVDGELRYRQVSASPVRDSVGNIVGSVSVVRDITRRKRAEQAVRESEERYRTLFETMTEGFALCEVICDAAGTPCDYRHLAVNPAYERHTGVRSEDILNRTLREAFPQAEPRWVERFGQVALTGEPARFEEWFGALGRWFEVSVFQTRPGRFGLVFRDVTARRRAAEERQRLAGELADRVGELQAILDAAPVAIWIAHDPQCLRITGNAYADQMVMRTGRGGNVSRTASPGDEAVTYKVIRNGVEVPPRELPSQVAAATGQPVKEEEWELVFPDGRALCMLMSAVPLVDSAGHVRGSVAAGTDVTRRKRAEEALRESEAVLRGFFDSPGVMRGIVELVDGRIVHVSCNTAAGQMFGVDRESIEGKSATEMGASEEVARAWVGLYEEARRSGKPVSMEYARRGADGVERWLLATASYVGTGHSGNPRFAYTTLDLSERKRIEDALLKSQKRLELALEAAELGTWEVDTASGIVTASERTCAMFGFEHARPRVEEWVARLHPDDRERVSAEIGKAIAEGSKYETEYRVVGRDGSITWVFAKAGAVVDPRDQSVRLIGVAQDITRRKNAEQSLVNEKNRLDAVMQSLPVGVALLDAQGGNISCNPAFEQNWGGPRPATTSVEDYAAYQAWWTATGEPVQPEEWASARAVWKGETVIGQELEIQRFDGMRAFVLNSAAPIRDAQGRIAGCAVAILDITERKRAEQAVRQSEERFRLAVKAANDAVWDLDLATGVVSWNDTYAARYGRVSETANSWQWWADHIHPEDRERADRGLRDAIGGGESAWTCEYRFQRADGAWAHIYDRAYIARDASGKAWRVIGAMQDLTERKRAEDRLREAQKLESLGLLAGGVAHDFNNLLVGVIGNASLAREMLAPDDPILELLEGVISTGEQAAHLTRQMLAYAGKGKFVVEPLNLSALIPEISGLVRPSISKKIALHFALDESLPPVDADRGQVQQVFMNLALNAAEAIGSHDGLITVATGTQMVDGKNHVFLEVSDTGCGMDEATRAKIFDPFFSTKFTGRGLGLAAVAGIVRGHGGAIHVSSAPGKGSCFRVLFPAAAREAARPALAAAAPALRGAGVVLVVDDEKTVRELAKRALELHGYTVLLADSGIAAIDILRRHPGDIALVVLDLSMPNMSGEEALPELRKIRPGINVVVSSGYSEAEAMTLFHGQRVASFIQKPYTSTRLAEKVKVCIG